MKTPIDIKKILKYYHEHQERWPTSKQPTAHWIAEQSKVPVAIVTCILQALAEAGIIKWQLLDKTILAKAKQYVAEYTKNKK